MACGDVLSLEDLQTAKKHQIFEAEVITGKAGGVAGGATIGTATNPVTGQTQQTLPSILADLGFDVQSWTSSTGGVLASANQVFLNDTPGSLGLGDYYAWGGTFPKTVPAGTDPALVGSGYIMRSSRLAGVQAREALRRSYAEAGYNLVAGSFEAGGTLTSATDVLLHEASGKAYSGAGPYPQAIVAGTNPAAGGFTAVAIAQSTVPDYAGLRAYTGEAKVVYVVGGFSATARPEGITGTFVHDKNNTSSVDNGGTVIVGADGRRWVRQFVGALSVGWFGAKGDGVTDDTLAIKAAVNYCKAKLTTVNNYTNGGMATLYFPQGIYVVSSAISVSGVTGFRMFGDGWRTSVILFTGYASNLFSYSSYTYCSADDMSFVAGTVTMVDGKPQVNPPTTKDCTSFKFNGNGGGTEFRFKRCLFMYWGKVYTTKDSTVNDDSHYHDGCVYLYNHDIWDNTNNQAVEWAFNDCKMLHNTGAVFNNPGSSLWVRGGDYINPGNFLQATIANTGLDSSFVDVRFENYQNIDPTSSPKLLVLSGSHTGLHFERCSARGGGSLAGKTAATLSGSFEVTMRNCVALSGTWEITANSSSGGVLSTLTLENTALTINQTVSAGQANKPINVRCMNYPNGQNSRINRNFRGATNSQTTPNAGNPMVDTVAIETAVNAATVSKSIPVFVIAPYNLVLSDAKFILTNNTANPFDIVIWKDSAKAVKLGEALGLNANGVSKVFKINDMLTYPVFTAASNPMYVEIIAAGNAGTVKGQLNFTFEQTYQ